MGRGINFPQVFRDQLRAPLSPGAAGIVKGDDAPGGGLGLPIPDGVGMEGQVEVIIAAVGLPDGGGRRGVRIVAAEADAVRPQIGLHGVGDLIHPVFLTAAAGDIGVPVLGGRT